LKEEFYIFISITLKRYNLINTYFIKSIIYSAFTLSVMACSSALDKKYELFSREK